MKTFITNSFFILLMILMTFGCASQVNLSKAVSDSRNDTPNLRYIDSSGKGYERGVIGGMRMKVIFNTIKFNKEKKTVKVEGVATVFFNSKDTVGLCCVDYFIAQPVNSYLTKIRFLGETNSNQVGNTSKPDGYFSVEIKLNAEDRLYFIGSGGTGLDEYSIGKACFDSLSVVRRVL